MDVKEWGIEKAFVLCKGNIARSGGITYVPLYMTMFLEPAPLPETLTYEIDLSALQMG